jgi:hypothetical protein
MAVTVGIDGDDLVVRLTGWASFASLRRRVSVPVTLVRSVSVRAPAAARAGLRWRVFGSFFPGLVAAGLFRARGRWQFWYVTRAPRVLVVETAGRYERLVLQVPDPDAVAESLGEQGL